MGLHVQWGSGTVVYKSYEQIVKDQPMILEALPETMAPLSSIAEAMVDTPCARHVHFNGTCGVNVDATKGTDLSLVQQASMCCSPQRYVCLSQESGSQRAPSSVTQASFVMHVTAHL